MQRFTYPTVHSPRAFISTAKTTLSSLEYMGHKIGGTPCWHRYPTDLARQHSALLLVSTTRRLTIFARPCHQTICCRWPAQGYLQESERSGPCSTRVVVRCKMRLKISRGVTAMGRYRTMVNERTPRGTRLSISGFDIACHNHFAEVQSWL